jgi:hypothetical protein
VRAEPQAADAFRLPVAYELGELDCVVTTESTARAVEGLPVPHTIGLVRTTADRIARHELGDTRHRVVTYQAVGTTRYQEYFPLEVIANRENLEAAGPPMPVDVRSSARPPAPRILYAVPTFGWESYPGGRRRVGGGVRLYLDRPWFASGAGERLAVVLTTDQTPGNTPYVSRWGQDPMWTGSALPDLRAEHFHQTGDDVAYLEGTADELRAPRAASRSSSSAISPSGAPSASCGTSTSSSRHRSAATGPSSASRSRAGSRCRW